MSSKNGTEEKTNLKVTILDSARRLFVEQGYKATSIKQIAESSNCTTAALYYYFKDGKAQILQEVINSVTGMFVPILEQIQGKDSLYEMLVALGQVMKDESPRLINRLSWLMLEFDNMDGAIREKVYNNQLAVHNMLRDEVARFIRDEKEISAIAWMLQFTFFGYAHFSAKFGIHDTRFDYAAFTELMAQRISTAP